MGNLPDVYDHVGDKGVCVTEQQKHTLFTCCVLVVYVRVGALHLSKVQVRNVHSRKQSVKSSQKPLTHGTGY